MSIVDEVIGKVVEATHKGALEWEHAMFKGSVRGFACSLKDSQFKLIDSGNDLAFQVGDEDPVGHPLLSHLLVLIEEEESKRRRDDHNRAWEKALHDLSAS